MKNNDVDADRTKRGEKKDDKKRQYELSKCFDTVWPSNEGSATKRRVEQFGRLSPSGSRHVSKNIDKLINNDQETTVN